jgi:hypothetical protein
MPVEIRMSLPLLLALGALLAPGPQGKSKSAAQLSTIPGDLDEALDPEVQRQLAAIDPLLVGWTTEALNSRCGKRLKLLAAILGENAHPEAAELEELVVPDYRGMRLRPEELRPVFADAAFEVQRGPEVADLDELPVEGREGLAEDLARLVAPLWGDHAEHAGEDGAHGSGAHLHFKFKIIHVNEREDGVRTDLYYAADGESGAHVVEQSATWRVEWALPTEAADLRIRSILRRDFEEVHARGTGAPLFADCTESVFADAPSFRRQLVQGIDHWRESIPRVMGLPLLGHPMGIAVGDVNGDLLDDFFLCQPGGLPNLLFVNQGDGTVRPGPRGDANLLDFTRSALLVDWDGDGDRDLAAIVRADVVLFANDGSGRFQWKTLIQAPGTVMLSAADFDEDGDLDLYATAYARPDEDDAWPVPYHDAENGQPNVLIENLGDWRLANATDERGLGRNNTRFSFAAGWEDYDEDGDQDLYVANDFGRNCLYRNDEGRFTDVAPEAGVEDLSAGMSCAWDDFNGDGRMDIFVSNMFSSAGNRVTYQRRFKPTTEQDVREHFQRHARGNTLFVNAGDGTFHDVSLEAGITMGRWAWGSIFTDLNNDSRLDLVVPNGFLTSTRSQDL